MAGTAQLLWFDDSGVPEGGGPVLVLLHAFPLSSVTWARVLPLLTPHARVVRIDLPGLGRSPVPAVPPSMETVARAVLAVLDGLGVERAVVHGVSTGGYAALALAGLSPDRVAGLALSSTTPWLGAPDVPAERRAVADAIITAGSTAPVLDSADGGLGATAHAEQPGLVELVRGLIESADPAGVAWMARAIASRADTSSVLTGFPGPVLLLFGEEDLEVPEGTVAGMAELRAEASSTTVAVLPLTGHLLALEQPEHTAGVLVDFLASLG